MLRTNSVMCFTTVALPYKLVARSVGQTDAMRFIRFCFAQYAMSTILRSTLCMMALSLCLSACGGGGGGNESGAGTVDQAQGVGSSAETGSTEQRAQVKVTPVVSNTAVPPTTSAPNRSEGGSRWGTPKRPFSAQSPWNSRPVSPVLSDVGVPTDSYVPYVDAGSFSTGVFEATATDTSMDVYGPVGKQGIWDPDSEVFKTKVTIPRWPANTVAASGTDGHADIVDPIAGVIHSFWQLKQVNGVWRATQYAWTRLDGRGWADPAHWFQGARAAAVPTMGGLIRTHEVDDGDVMYRHALAMSLTFSGLAPDPAYVFPATSADTHAASLNYGRIPEGALLMLPSSFDTSTIASPMLRKIAETLKVYGGYVVDQNVGTPFVIYAEIGSGLSMHPPGGWNSRNASDIQRIRAELRMVTSAAQWLDGNGQPVDFLAEKFNLMSLRGPWTLSSGSRLGVFNTWTQRIEFQNSGPGRISQRNTTGTGLNRVSWGKVKPGATYKLTAKASGDARLRFEINLCGPNSENINSGALTDGQSFTFVWPQRQCWHAIHAISGEGQSSSVGAELVEVTTP